MKQNHYVELLGREYEKRRSKNSHYSLRSFARDIEIPPSLLSEVFNEKKGISLETAKAIISKLNFSDYEKKLFSLSVRAKHSRSKLEKTRANRELKEFLATKNREPLYTETYVDWVTSAVLKLSQVPGEIEDDLKVSKRLSVPKFTISNAKRFLRRLGFIKTDVKGKDYLKHRGEGRSLNVDYGQILELASQNYSLRKHDRDLFHHNPILIDEKDAFKARTIILNAFEKLSALESKKDDASLFFVSTQLFKVDKR